jgi:hypothetical protein
MVSAGWRSWAWVGSAGVETPEQALASRDEGFDLAAAVDRSGVAGPDKLGRRLADKVDQAPAGFADQADDAINGAVAALQDAGHGEDAGRQVRRGNDPLPFLLQPAPVGQVGAQIAGPFLNRQRLRLRARRSVGPARGQAQQAPLIFGLVDVLAVVGIEAGDAAAAVEGIDPADGRSGLAASDRLPADREQGIGGKADVPALRQVRVGCAVPSRELARPGLALPAEAEDAEGRRRLAGLRASDGSARVPGLVPARVEASSFRAWARMRRRIAPSTPQSQLQSLTARLWVRPTVASSLRSPTTARIASVQERTSAQRLACSSAGARSMPSCLSSASVMAGRIRPAMKV